MMMKFTLLVALALALLAGCPRRGADQGGVDRPRKVEVPEIVAENTGLPVVLTLPTEAHGADELDMLPPILSAERTNWQTGFHYEGGFPTIVKHFDEQLKPQGYARFSGPALEKDVNFLPDSGAKPTQALGKKTWISKDKTIVVILNFAYKRATDSEPEINNYELVVTKSKE